MDASIIEEKGLARYLAMTRVIQSEAGDGTAQKGGWGGWCPFQTIMSFLLLH
jgi:hypothetical protein